MTPDQLYWSRPARGYAQYRGPVDGLYMCGSSTHPGGGVSGAPGHNAARAVLDDARRAERHGAIRGPSGPSKGRR
jgi:phytoene dehydrogenase-like protein